MTDSFSLQLLDDFFTFRSVSGRNIRFTSIASNEPFFVNKNNAFDDCLPHVYAGGSITYPSPATVEMKGLPYLLLIYSTGGKGRLLFPKAECLVSSGSLQLICAQTPLSFQTIQTPFSYRIYFLGGHNLAPYVMRLIKKENSIFTAAHVPSDYISDHMRQIDRILEYPTRDSEFYIANFLQDIFTECIQLSLPKEQQEFSLPKHVQYMKHRFERAYFENHSLESLEKETGVNRYRLCRDFSNYMGSPPIQYLNQIRILQSKLLLEQTDGTVHEIGTQVGIPNTGHFIRLFEKSTGVTPANYRKNSRHFLMQNNADKNTFS